MPSYKYLTNVYRRHIHCVKSKVTKCHVHVRSASRNLPNFAESCRTLPKLTELRRVDNSLNQLTFRLIMGDNQILLLDIVFFICCCIVDIALTGSLIKYNNVNLFLIKTKRYT